MPPLGLSVQLACIWEATARKPGNVHRYCDFSDTSYLDYLASAVAIAPVFESAPGRPVGEIVLSGVRATQGVVSTNTNLGIVLLLAPLAAVPVGEELRRGLARLLAALDVADARAVYEAIRLTRPGGLGRVAEQDVRFVPDQTLRQVMELAAGRDLVARQYASSFQDIFEDGVPALGRALDRLGELESAIILCHLELMARHPDTLIGRKRGQAEAEESARRARELIEADWPRGPTSTVKLAEFDAWLRAKGNGRNPGTTADLVTACLFVALREGILTLPLQYPWSVGPHHA
jgi:triphosphoribosyl-dephospho-CoA synthase